MYFPIPLYKDVINFVSLIWAFKNFNDNIVKHSKSVVVSVHKNTTNEPRAKET